MKRFPNLVRESRFIDSMYLKVRGGTGGMGLERFGGVGGRGGNVYLEAKPKVRLSDLTEKFKASTITAESGESSKKRQIFGKPGENKVVKVPIGVEVYDEYNRKLGELNSSGQRILVAQGGSGGGPDTNFCGLKGIAQSIYINFKLIADVGFVGFPNAGKSTLLRGLSRSKAVVADYAFTTLRPNIGVMRYSDLRQITVADLPGIIEGSNYNLGMGHKFLKHIERTRLLLFVVDIFGFQLTPQQPFRNSLETILLLNKELELFNKDLLKKPALIVMNKMDLKGAEKEFQMIKHHLEDLNDFASTLPEEIRPKKVIEFSEIFPISALNKDDLKLVRDKIRYHIDSNFEKTFIEVSQEKEALFLEEAKKELKEMVPQGI